MVLEMLFLEIKHVGNPSTCISMPLAQKLAFILKENRQGNPSVENAG
jgi:hypothetical protein